MAGVIQPVERGRSERAICNRIQLLELLAPDGKCAICGKTFTHEELTIGHVDGVTYNRYALPAWSRAEAYWAEYLDGVQLRAECNPCNGRDGATRLQGKPRWRGEAAVHRDINSRQEME